MEKNEEKIEEKKDIKATLMEKADQAMEMATQAKLAAQSVINKERADNLMKDIRNATDELVKMAKTAKEKYDKSDEATKKKIFAGVIGASALIAGIIGISKMCCRKKD